MVPFFSPFGFQNTIFRHKYVYNSSVGILLPVGCFRIVAFQSLETCFLLTATFP
jgi:hypothetical protein